MKKSTFIFLLVAMMFLADIGLTTQSKAQPCTIEKINCPPSDLKPACASNELNGVAGAYVSWTPPALSLSCPGMTSGYAFEMSYDLPESQKGCWLYSRVQRIGTGGGRLRLWESNKTNSNPNPNFTTPSYFITSSTNCSMSITNGSGHKITCNVYLVDANGMQSAVNTSFQVSGSGSYPFSVTAPQPGIYRLFFEFTGSGNNSDYIELLQINASLFGSSCSGDINFYTTSDFYPGAFFPVGTTTVTYTATCNSCVPPLTSTCSFNVVVNQVTATTEKTDADCGLNNGTITLSSVSSNSAAAFQYNLNNAGWVSFSSPLTIKDLAPGTFTINVRDYFASNPGYCQIQSPLSVNVGRNVDAINPLITCPAMMNIDGCSISAIAGSGLPFSSVQQTLTPDQFTATGASATDACGITSWKYRDSQSGTLPVFVTRNFTVADASGNTATCSQALVVKDFTAPVPTLASLPDLSGECSVTAAPPKATDNCAGKLTATTSDPLTYTAQGIHIINWIYNDGNGNTTTQPQTIIVHDITAPVPAKASLPVLSGECSVTATAPFATDNCAGTVTATTADPLTYKAQGTYTITWIYDDGNGNKTTQLQTVIVDDITAPVPVIASLPVLSGECSVTALAPSASDKCVGMIPATTPDPLTYSAQGTHTITWVYDDGNGNTSSQRQTVVIDDITAPVPDLAVLPVLKGESFVSVTIIPEATDNCSGAGIKGTTHDPLSYTTQGTRTITWTYDDGNGNITTQVQTVIVDDITAPVPDVAILPVLHGECSVTATPPLATDNSVGTVTATTADPLTYASQGTFTITWIYDDGNGNRTTQLQSVIVDDITTPVPAVGTLPILSGECSVTASAPIATDNCAGTVTATTTDPLTYSAQGTYTITWKYDDGNGNSTTQVQTIIVHDVTAPVPAISLPVLSGECSVIATAPKATDNCAGTVTATTADPLTYSAQGTYTITWKYDDGNGNSTTQVQTIIVHDVTTPVPAVASLPVLSGECSLTATAPKATDNCAGTVTATTADPLTYSAQGTYTITWEYSDGNGNSTTQLQTIIVHDLTKPVPDVASLPELSGECSVTATASTATDNCAGKVTATTADPLTYSAQGNYSITWKYDDGNGNTTTQLQAVIVHDLTAPVPVVATLPVLYGEYSVTAMAPSASDNCAGTIMATTADPLTYSVQGTYTITWIYDDGHGNSKTQLQTVIVDDNTAPVPDVASLPVLSGECSVTATASTATDNCAGTVIATTPDPLTYSAQGTYSINWTYNDGNGNTTTQVQTIIVHDVTAPVPAVASLPALSGECSVTATAPTATDNCAGTVIATTPDPLTYSAQGTYSINWTYNDGNGNTTTQAQTVIVDDITAPVPAVASLPALSGESSVTAIAPTANDNCAGIVTATTSDPLTYSIQGTYSITWTYNDGNGNSTTQTQAVIVDDITAPVPDVASLPALSGECSVTATTPTATDNCAGTVTATTADPLTYLVQGTYSITWTYNDGNGNSITQVQEVIVDDNTAPVPAIASLPALSGECSVTAIAPTATDNCAGILTATTADPLTYTAQGTYSITWTYNDGNGNITTQLQAVIVDDNTAPAPGVASLPVLSGECSVTAIAPTATDNCGGIIMATTADPLTYTAQGTYSITWTYDDGNGNTTIQQQAIIVDDITAPVPDVIALPALTGESSVTAGVPAASDNCVGTVSATTEDPLTYIAQGTYTITWTYDDGNGNITTQLQTVIMDDISAPVPDVASLPVLSGECSVTPSAPTASDNCAGTITASTTDPLTYTEQGTYTVTWIYNDGNGNTTTQLQTVIVDDKTAPVPATAVLPVLTGECSVTVTAIPVAIDNCSGADVNATTSDLLTYNAQGTYTITWIYDDGNGNTTSQLQTVIVDDTTAPIPAVASLPVLSADCSVTAMVPVSTDNCIGTVMGTTMDPLNYASPGSYVITWTYDDGNGNRSMQKQDVIVTDIIPVMICPENITINLEKGSCEASVNVPVPVILDNCGVHQLVNDFNGGPNATGLYPFGTTTILWNVSDIHGLTSSCSMQVVVTDTQLPSIACPANISAMSDTTACRVDVTIPVPVFTDACGIGSILNDFTNTANASGNYPIGNTVVKYTVTNTHGNKSSCYFNVVLTSPPVAVDDYCSTPMNKPIAIHMLANDKDCDHNIDASTVMVLTTPEHGTVIISPSSGEATYTPDNNFYGTDTYVYQVCDVNGYCAIAMVHIYIEDTRVHHPLVAVNDTITTLMNSPAVIMAVVNDQNIDSSPIMVSICAQPLHGMVTLNEHQTFSYFPQTAYVGMDEFCYTICEKGTTSPCSSAKVIVFIAEEDRSEIIIYNTFTPNGDGKNDTWWIEGIEANPSNEIVIYDRWGEEVWSAAHYDNQSVVWAGKNMHNESLDDGTYFYVLKFIGNNTVRTGWVKVQR